MNEANNYLIELLEQQKELLDNNPCIPTTEAWQKYKECEGFVQAINTVNAELEKVKQYIDKKIESIELQLKSQ